MNDMDKTLGTWPNYNFGLSWWLAKKEEKWRTMEMHRCIAIGMSAVLVGDTTLYDQWKQKSGNRNN